MTPTPEQLEEVARAICLQACVDDGYNARTSQFSVDQGMWRNHLEQARAAWEAVAKAMEKAK